MGEPLVAQCTGGDGCHGNRCNGAQGEVTQYSLVGKNNSGDGCIKSGGNSGGHTATQIDLMGEAAGDKALNPDSHSGTKVNQRPVLSH